MGWHLAPSGQLKTKSHARRTLARQTAELIARELFGTMFGNATRLKLEFKGDEVSGPGWCERAVADHITEILNRKHVRKAVVKK